MLKRNTSFTLSEEEAVALERQSRAQGLSKSALVGRLIRQEDERQGLAQRVAELEAQVQELSRSGARR